VKRIIDKYRRSPVPQNLPPKLSVREIADLWYPDDTKARNDLWFCMGEAVRRGALIAEVGIKKTVEYSRDPAGYPQVKRNLTTPRTHQKAIGVSYSPDYEEAMVERDSFMKWLKEESEWPIPPQIPLSAWFISPSNSGHNWEHQELPIEIMTTLHEVQKEVFRLYNSVKGDGLNMGFVVDYFRENKKDYPCIRISHLQDPELYSAAIGKEKRTFCGRLLQKIINREHSQKLGHQKLYDEANAIRRQPG
jgi:hypothetical protein